MLRRFLPVALLLLCIPLTASAKQVSTWDFTQGQMPGDWQTKGWTSAVLTTKGFEIHTTAAGSMGRLMDLPHPVDVIQITASTPREIAGLLLWHVPGTPPDVIYQLPITLQPGSSGTDFVDLTVADVWPRRPDLIGFAFPAGANMTLERVELVGFSVWEKLWNNVRSFWIFDTFNATSINFLWGPILRSAPITREALFSSPPPQGWSANRVLYTFLALGSFLLWLWYWRGGLDPRRALLFFLSLCAGLWLFYDFRMGAEFFSYAAWDVRTYLTQAPEQRKFRQFQNFFTAVEQSLPVLTASPTYGFLCPDGLPLASRLQYFTYPSITAGNATLPRPANWLIFRRDDVRVDERNRLWKGDAMLAEGGTILKRFDDTSFLYGKAP